MNRGYVVEYYLRSHPMQVHYETVEDAHTPQAAVEAIMLAEGEEEILEATTHPIQ